MVLVVVLVVIVVLFVFVLFVMVLFVFMLVVVVVIVVVINYWGRGIDWCWVIYYGRWCIDRGWGYVYWCRDVD